MARPIIAFLFLFMSHALFASYPPAIKADDFDNLKITRHEIFNGSELWGLINGGADLYLEYGFDKLLLQEITLNGEQFRIEINQMQDEISAFGIYSVSVYQCLEKGKLTENDCVNAYQYQFAKGNIYTSLINYSGSEKARQVSFQMAEKLIMAIEPEAKDQPKYSVRKSNPDREIVSSVYKGILGLQNGMPQWFSLFEGVGDFTLMVMTRKDSEGVFRAAVVDFPDAGQAKNFTEKLKDGTYLQIPVSGSENVIVFVDSSAYKGNIDEAIKDLVPRLTKQD
jgi:hypothetical protein